MSLCSSYYCLILPGGRKPLAVHMSAPTPSNCCTDAASRHPTVQVCECRDDEWIKCFLSLYALLLAFKFKGHSAFLLHTMNEMQFLLGQRGPPHPQSCLQHNSFITRRWYALLLLKWFISFKIFTLTLLSYPHCFKLFYFKTMKIRLNINLTGPSMLPRWPVSWR